MAADRIDLAYVVVSALDTLLAGSDNPNARKARALSKPALMPLLLASTDQPPVRVAAALGGSWIGDVALLARSDAGLAGGIGGFALGHAAYLAQLRAESKTRSKRSQLARCAFLAGFSFSSTALFDFMTEPKL